MTVRPDLELCRAWGGRGNLALGAMSSGWASRPVALEPEQMLMAAGLCLHGRVPERAKAAAFGFRELELDIAEGARLLAAGPDDPGTQRALAMVALAGRPTWAEMLRNRVRARRGLR